MSKPHVCATCGRPVARSSGYRGTVAELRESDKNGRLIRVRRFCELLFAPFQDLRTIPDPS